MSTKENKELVRRFWKSLNEAPGDPDNIRLLCEKYDAPNFIYHSPSRDLNREQTIEMMVLSTSALPDQNVTIDDIVAEGDTVAIRYTMQATHRGTFMGIPATGKRFIIKGVLIDKIAEDKFIEEWGLSDTLGLMTQLGGMPGVGTTKK